MDKIYNNSLFSGCTLMSFSAFEYYLPLDNSSTTFSNVFFSNFRLNASQKYPKSLMLILSANLDNYCRSAAPPTYYWCLFIRWTYAFKKTDLSFKLIILSITQWAMEIVSLSFCFESKILSITSAHLTNLNFSSY